MPRSTFRFPYRSFEAAEQTIQNLLQSRGFKLQNENGEIIWRKGSGFLIAAKCIKVMFAEDTVLLEGWVSDNFRESPLEGMVGSFPKGQVLKVIEEIKYSIQ